MDNFASLDTPGDPGGVLVLELSAFKKYISCFVTVAPPWRIFFTFMIMVPNVSFISMVIEKVFLSVSIATISNFLQKCTLWRHDYETLQAKIGQCGSSESVNIIEKSNLSWLWRTRSNHIHFWLFWTFDYRGGNDESWLETSWFRTRTWTLQVLYDS